MSGRGGQSRRLPALHGPSLGPDGRIYWTIGDKGVNATITVDDKKKVTEVKRQGKSAAP